MHTSDVKSHTALPPHRARHQVTADYQRHAAELSLRKKLTSDWMVEYFDSLEDVLGNYTTGAIAAT